MMALELGMKGIRCNAVNPTVVLTAMGKKNWSGEQGDGMRQKIPLGRFAEEEDVISGIFFLLGNRSSMVNGTMLPIDGGFLATR